MHSFNVMPVGSNFMLHRVIRGEINGCVRFRVYDDFKVRLLSDNEKVRATYTSVALFFVSRSCFLCMSSRYHRKISAIVLEFLEHRDTPFSG